MKNIHVIPLVALCATVIATPAFSQSYPTQGLVAYYPFDGNANDASGNSKNGVAAGVTSTTNRFGVTASAYQFGPADAAVTVASLASTNLTALTLSAWVKPTALVENYIINKWEAFDSSLADYNLCLLSDQRVLFGNGRHGSAQAITTTSSLSLGQWYHIVATVDSAGAATIWVDGVSRAAGNILPLVPPAAVPVRIGQEVTSGGGIIDSFDGCIDDVRIYNRALSQSEVQQLYAYESQPPCVPHGATATAQVVNGFFVGAAITDGGCGYTNVPLVKIIGSGTGATATATLNNGVVTQINITSPGSGYSTNTVVRIASPPFMPWLEMGVSKVKVTMHVIMGKNYILESSSDLAVWTQVGVQFTAEDEVIVQEFDVDATGRYFRIQQVP